MSDPVAAAKHALTSLYQLKTSINGEPPSFETFYPIDLNQLASTLGWRIERVDIAGSTQANEPLDAFADFEKKVISLGCDQSAERQTFSLAHEIGHIYLHNRSIAKELLRIRAIREKNSKRSDYFRMEQEANRFAAELLMPSKAVRQQFKKLFSHDKLILSSDACTSLCHLLMKNCKGENYPVEFAERLAHYTPNAQDRSLAKFFGVSGKALARRLIELQLIIE